MSKHNDDDLTTDVGIDVNDEIVSEHKKESITYIINIDCEILLPKEYRKAFVAIHKATEDDTIIVKVSSMGGSLDTGLLFYNALTKCKAHSIAEVQMALSAASIISLGCREIRPMKHAHMMIHTASWNAGGKSHEMKSQTDFFQKYCSDVLNDIYDTFLTKKEINDVLKGKDLYINDKDLIRRLKTWIPAYKRNNNE